MKRIFFYAAVLFLPGLAPAAPSGLPLGKVVMELNFHQDDLESVRAEPQSPNLPPPYHISGHGPHTRISFKPISGDPKNFELKVEYQGAGPYPLQLFNLPDELSGMQYLGNHYAIVGEVRCEKATAGSYLEMNSYFGSPFPRKYPEAGEFFSRTTAGEGPMGKLQGTQDWREFWLPFDATGATERLRNVVLNLQLAGPGTVSLRKIRLVRYDGNPFGMAPAKAPENSSSAAAAISWNSFFLGAFAALAALFLVGGLVFGVKRLQKKQHERELRRIASLDG